MRTEARIKVAKGVDLLAESLGGEELLAQRDLKAHHERFYRAENDASGPFSHVRLCIYPDGGVSRQRVYGRRASR